MGFTNLSLAETLGGGQSFVWDQDVAGIWHGVINQVIVRLRIDGSRLEWQTNTPLRFSKKDLLHYLWIDTTYQEAIDTLPWRSDLILAKCMDSLPGLRILRQPLDEILFYFLLSPVKSIPQIKRLVERFLKSLVLHWGCGKHGFSGLVKISGSFRKRV